MKEFNTVLKNPNHFQFNLARFEQDLVAAGIAKTTELKTYDINYESLKRNGINLEMKKVPLLLALGIDLRRLKKFYRDLESGPKGFDIFDARFALGEYIRRCLGSEYGVRGSTKFSPESLGQLEITTNTLNLLVTPNISTMVGKKRKPTYVSLGELFDFEDKLIKIMKKNICIEDYFVYKPVVPIPSELNS
jgi:hypothetical protein